MNFMHVLLVKIMPSTWPTCKVNMVPGFQSKLCLLCAVMFFYWDLRMSYSSHKWTVTLCCSNEGRQYRAPPNFPVKLRPSDIIEFGSDKKVGLFHFRFHERNLIIYYITISHRLAPYSILANWLLNYLHWSINVSIFSKHIMVHIYEKVRSFLG